MPKNKTGGNKAKRGQNNYASRDLTFKEEGQEYGIAAKMLGNCRVTVHCNDGKERLGRICGQMRKRRIYVNQDDIILVCLRDYEDSKCDIVMKYTRDEARNLQAYGELPKDLKLEKDDTQETNNDDFPFEFGEPDDEDDIIDEVTEIKDIDVDDI